MEVWMSPDVRDVRSILLFIESAVFFWVKWKIQLAIDIEVWEFGFGIKRFLME